MATPGINAASDGRIAISDTYLNDHSADPAAIIDCCKMEPREAFENMGYVGGRWYMLGTAAKGNNGHFEPRGINVNWGSSQRTTDLDATDALVNGCLRSDKMENPIVERLACAVTHPNRYRYIYAQGTTARGIKLHM